MRTETEIREKLEQNKKEAKKNNEKLDYYIRLENTTDSISLRDEAGSKADSYASRYEHNWSVIKNLEWVLGETKEN